MTGIEGSIAELLMEISHHPYLLFLGVTLILFGSSFGLPLPEELTLITAGMIASASLAEANRLGIAPSINVWTLALVCFSAVLISDLLVFWLGRQFGLPLLKRRPFSRFLSEGALNKVQSWTSQYGTLACFIFRFTPGIRFPGHFMCGALKISYRKFLLTDGMAALLTVPTQVLLLAFYGSEILGSIKQFKIWLFSGLGLLLLLWVAYKFKNRIKNKAAQVNPSTDTAA